MIYLNQLGANVRNHMSMIEDKYVEQARHNFPTAEKKPRATGVNPPTASNHHQADVLSNPTASKPNPTVNTYGARKTPVEKPATAPSGIKPGETREIRPPAPARPLPKPQQNKRSGPQAPGQPRPQALGQPRPQAPGQPRSQAPGQPRSQAPGQPRPQASGQPRPQAQTHGQPKPYPRVQQQQNTVAAENRGGVQRPQGTKPGVSPGHRDAPRQQNANSLKNRGPQSQSNPKPKRPAADNRSPNRPQQPQGEAQHNRGQSRSNWFQGNNNRSGNRSQTGTNQKGQSGRSHAAPSHRHAPQKPKGPATNVKSVQLPSHMTVKEFAQLLELAAGEIIKKLMGLGVMATINQEIDLDTMTLIAEDFGITVTAALTEEQKLQVEEVEDDPSELIKRSPVVTIMGHVDHGKTSLLDAIRETNVIAQEAGGITQHIGAYQVELNDRKITFLDTPGHAAFTAMRARGAQVTDIAILVVAADDGVMPQTVEALNHAKDANVSIIVAINKIDKPGANPDRVKQDLTEYGLVAEEWGGDTIFVPVSAKQRIGIENMLEMILLVADIKDLKANPNRAAKGTIIEAQLDKGRGPVATILVQNGTLEMGDSIIAGAAFGKVRALINDKGKRVKKAGPATPVEVIGFDDLPEAGDTLNVISDERLARQLADKRMQLKRENELNQNQKVTLNDLFTKIKEGAIKELKIIIKADVQGSVEAIRQSLERLSNDEVKVKVIHGGVGAIGEHDVMLASAANAIIIGFNVRPDPMAKRLSEKENVDIQLYRVIYNIIEDVQKAMEGMLEPEYKEVVNGRAEIRAVYKVPKVGNVAGCYVAEGKINRNNDIRILRDNIVIHEGKIDSLKRFKDDVREVAEGYECGIGVANFNDVKEGDIIEAFFMEEIKRTK
jgi:translation initiation factor IF-2